MTAPLLVQLVARVVSAWNAWRGPDASHVRYVRGGWCPECCLFHVREDEDDVRRRAEDDGQRPLPFKSGIAARLRRPARTWKYDDGQIARVCPTCGCNAERRCSIALEGEGSASCVPAGVWGRRVCSACRQPCLPGVGR